MAICNRAEATIRNFRTRPHGNFIPADFNDAYLAACLYGERVDYGTSKAYCDIRSDLPAAVGLKTSSAVGVSLAAASHVNVFGTLPKSSELVHAVTEAAKATGRTQAGSVDDSWCATLGGVVVADANAPTQILGRFLAPSDVEVVIFVPSLPQWAAQRRDRRSLLQPYSREFEGLTQHLVRTHDLFGTMTAAGLLTARAFGADTTFLKRALDSGAYAVTLSGKGPSMAALVDTKNVESVVHAWDGQLGRIIRTKPDGKGLQITTTQFSLER
jgi:shikimate kinase